MNEILWHRCSIQSPSNFLPFTIWKSVWEQRKTAHSSVKYQKCLSDALITALETVLLCLVSCSHLNHATTVAAGYYREHHHQKMNSATFPSTTWLCSGTGTPVCQLCLCCSLPDHWKEPFLWGIVHGALPQVAANAYFGQASLPKAEASALRIPCSQHVFLRLSGTERIRFNDCITLSLLDLSAWLLICNLLKSYFVLWSLKTVSKFWQF